MTPLDVRRPSPVVRQPSPVVASPEVAEYLEHLRNERDVSPNTILAYARDLSELVFFFSSYYGGEWTWQGVDRLAIRGFLAHLTRKDCPSGPSRGRCPACGASIGIFTGTRSSTRIRREPSARRDSRSTSRRISIARRSTCVPDGRGARVGRRVRRRSQPRDPRAVLLHGHASVGAAGHNRGDLDLVAQQVKVSGKGRKERIIPIGDQGGARAPQLRIETRRTRAVASARGADRRRRGSRRAGKRLGVRGIRRS